MSSGSLADLIFASLTPDPDRAGQWRIDEATLVHVEEAVRIALTAGDPAIISRDAMGAIGFLMQRGDAPLAVGALLQLARALQPLVAEALEASSSIHEAHVRQAAALLAPPRPTQTSAEDTAELGRRGKVTRLSELAPQPIRIR